MTHPDEISATVPDEVCELARLTVMSWLGTPGNFNVDGFNSLAEQAIMADRRASRPDTPAVEGEAILPAGTPEAYLQAILHYTEGFYGAAIKHGMAAGSTADAIAHVERAARNLAALAHPAPTQDVSDLSTHRHKKRGTEYVLIGYGKMQTEFWLQLNPTASWNDGAKFILVTQGTKAEGVDMREVAIYRSATDPTEIWVRPREEFEDGRFDTLTSAGSGK